MLCLENRYTHLKENKVRLYRTLHTEINYNSSTCKELECCHSILTTRCVFCTYNSFIYIPVTTYLSRVHICFFIFEVKYSSFTQQLLTAEGRYVGRSGLSVGLQYKATKQSLLIEARKDLTKYVMSQAATEENSNLGKGNRKEKCLPTVFLEHQGPRRTQLPGVKGEELRSSL